MPARRVAETRIRWTLRGWREVRRNSRPLPCRQGWRTEDRGSVIAQRHLDGGHRLTASAMTSRHAAVQTAERHLTQVMRIDRRLDARLLHGHLIHAVATGPMLGGRRRLRTGYCAVSSAKGQRRDQQYQEAKIVGPAPSHCRSMLPKPIAPRQCGKHRTRSRTHSGERAAALDVHDHACEREPAAAIWVVSDVS